MNFKNRVYIAGAISGRDYEEVKREFAWREYSLRMEGYKTFNPIRYCKPTWSWYRCMTVCLFHLIFRCNKICLPAYTVSKGVKIERKIAKALGYKTLIQFI